MDQLPRLGKRELICLLLFTCIYVVSVWRGFLFLWVLGMGYVILLWHSLSLPYNYFGGIKMVTSLANISLNAEISDCSNSTDIDSCLSEFVGIIDDVSSPFFKKYHSKNATENKNKEPTENKNPWYNEECHESKYIFLHMLNKYRSFKTDENRKNMLKA